MIGRFIARASLFLSLAIAGAMAEPTHYLYEPRSATLGTAQFVLSSHELSFGLDSRLQLFFCPLSAVDPFRDVGYFGIKEMFAGLKIGVGGGALALGISPGPHWIGGGFGFGGYFVHPLAGGNPHVDFSLGSQISGNYFTIDPGLGAGIRLGRYAQIIFEGGIPFGLIRDYDEFGFSMDGGIAFRYALPPAPRLAIDLGISAGKRLRPETNGDLWPFIDLSYSGRF